LELKPLNLDKLLDAISTGRLDSTKPIDMKAIYDANLVGKITDGVKLLSKVSICCFSSSVDSRADILVQGVERFDIPKLHIRVSAASASARAAVEKLGGCVETVYYNRLGLRAHLQPHKFDILPLNAAPPQRIALRYDTPQPFPAAPLRKTRASFAKQ
jgi:large subunit ribosomal protein L15